MSLARTLVFRRQYVAGSDRTRLPRDWSVSDLAPGFWLATHPELAVSRVSTPNATLVCLGHILDPTNPDRDNREVVEHLADESTSFSALEKATRGLGGRWLLFAGVRGDWRVYPDAAGTKTAFYTAGAPGGVSVGSTPSVLGETLPLQRDAALETEFLGGAHLNSWPGDVTPFRGVRQLLPNHYLNLADGTPHRFGPLEIAKPLPVDAAAAIVHEQLRGTIRSIEARGAFAIPLTGGYDSRALFAAAVSLGVSRPFFTIVDPNTPYHDIAIPRRLAAAFKTKVRFIRAKGLELWYWEVQRRNVADMIWDPGEIKIYTFWKELDGPLILTGSVAEIGRCFYYEDGAHPSKVTAELLASVGGYAGNRVAIEAFDRWLTDASSVKGVKPLDLFYWEHRLGNWMSMVHNGMDTACDVVAAYNSRAFIETVLALDLSYRRAPFELFRRICELGAPGSTRIPFNSSLAEAISDAVKRRIPWRLRHGLHRWRLRRAGLAYGRFS